MAFGNDTGHEIGRLRAECIRLRAALAESRLTVSKMREALVEGHSLAWVHEALADEGASGAAPGSESTP